MDHHFIGGEGEGGESSSGCSGNTGGYTNMVISYDGSIGKINKHVLTEKIERRIIHTPKCWYFFDEADLYHPGCRCRCHDDDEQSKVDVPAEGSI